MLQEVVSLSDHSDAACCLNWFVSPGAMRGENEGIIVDYLPRVGEYVIEWHRISTKPGAHPPTEYKTVQKENSVKLLIFTF